MPIHCKLPVRVLSEEEFRRLDYEVMGHAFSAHRELGRMFDEEVYQNDLAARLRAAGMKVETEVPLTVSFRDFAKQYFLDVVTEGAHVGELKTAATLSGEHERQLLTYLMLLGVRSGKLINFRPASVEHRTVNSVISADGRRRFEIVASSWTGVSDRVKGAVAILDELLKDWGAFLELPLYESALVHFMGGESIVMADIPVVRVGVPLGHMRAIMLEEGTVLRLTAGTSAIKAIETNLRRLLSHTRLRRMLWINFNLHRIEVRTLHT